jgi:enterochelin esterase-like enzyme
MIAASPPASPRIESLRQAVAAHPHDRADVVEVFWREVEDRGAPLVETLPGDDPLVTFLWRGDDETRTVVLMGDVAQGHPADHQLSRLEGTDVWFRTYRLPRGVRTTYRLSPNDSLVPWAAVTDWESRLSTVRLDPLNPHQFVFLSDPEDPHGRDYVLSSLELPGAPPQPWITPRPGTPAGRIEPHRLRSERLGRERRVWVYTPPGYPTADTPRTPPPERSERLRLTYPLVILFDGFEYTGAIPTPTILDNLHAAGLIPPTVAVLVDTRAQRARDLNCYLPFDAFVAEELLPWVRQRWHATTDPACTVIGGYSLGGLAAAFTALRHPELFGAVLSQSGAFWHGGPSGPGGPQGHDRPADSASDAEHEWLARLVSERPPGAHAPLRFYLDVGILETKPTDDGGPTFLVANRHLRTVLRARGYPVHYAEFPGGHDQFSWRGTLADGLIALLPARADT